MVKIGGTYENVKTQADADFFSQFFGETCKKMIGVKVTMKTCEVEPKKWLFCLHSDESDIYNLFDCYTEGVSQDVDNQFFGGKGKLQFKMNAAGDGFETDVCSEALGKMHYSEKYTDEGMQLTFTKDGKSFTEVWTRVVKTNGFYRYCKDENFTEFMRKEGMPDSIDFKAMTMDWKSCDAGFNVVETYGDLKVCHRGKFDEEYDIKFSAEGLPTVKAVVVKCGSGKFKSVLKPDNGSVSEWNFNFTEEGLCMCGTNLSSGDSCKLYMKRCVNTAGTWKPLSIIGVKEALTKLGCSADVSSNLANEYDARLEICQKGPATRWNWVSQHTPMDMIFKLNEEFECYDPAIKENVKIVITQCGKEFHWVSKYPKFSSKSKAIFGSDFMVMSSDIVGMDCPMKYIFERC